MITGTRCWPVVWLPGMPRMRISVSAPGSISGSPWSGIDAVVHADDEPRARHSRSPRCPVEPLPVSEPGAVGRLVVQHLDDDRLAGLGIVSPSASRVPGSAAWIVRVTDRASAPW